MQTSIRLSLALSLVAFVAVSASVVSAAEACGNNADKSACSDATSSEKSADASTTDTRARLELANPSSNGTIADGRRHGRSSMARERIEQGSSNGTTLNADENRASLNLDGAAVVDSNAADTRRHGRSNMARERIEQGNN